MFPSELLIPEKLIVTVESTWGITIVVEDSEGDKVTAVNWLVDAEVPGTIDEEGRIGKMDVVTKVDRFQFIR